MADFGSDSYSDVPPTADVPPLEHGAPTRVSDVGMTGLMRYDRMCMAFRPLFKDHAVVVYCVIAVLAALVVVFTLRLYRNAYQYHLMISAEPSTDYVAVEDDDGDDGGGGGYDHRQGSPVHSRRHESPWETARKRKA
jgi:hypothetical protein